MFTAVIISLLAIVIAGDLTGPRVTNHKVPEVWVVIGRPETNGTDNNYLIVIIRHVRSNGIES
jgi:hypothetical protein